MAQKVASLAILLVCFMASNAHATARMQNVGGRNTFHVHGVNGTAQSSIKSPESTNVSVVENWSLVCEDLCRVGFGGSRCGPSCIVGSQRQSNDTTKFSEFCPVLCDFGLGGHNCACRLVSKRPNAKTICHVLCRKFNLKIRGCSECKNAANCIDDIVGNHTTEAFDATITTLFSTNFNSNETMETSTASSTIVAFSSSITHVPLITTDTTASTSTSTAELTSEKIPDDQWTTTSTAEFTETTTTESSTPIEPSTTTTTPAVTTTPNWSVVCKNLCKIGEGGSLCNCDCAPLMSV